MEHITGKFFPLDENEFETVCKLANQQDTTLGRALSLLIAKGKEVMDTEDEEKNFEPLLNQGIVEPLREIVHTALWITQESERILSAIETTQVKPDTQQESTQQETQ